MYNICSGTLSTSVWCHNPAVPHLRVITAQTALCLRFCRWAAVGRGLLVLLLLLLLLYRYMQLCNHTCSHANPCLTCAVYLVLHLQLTGPTVHPVLVVVVAYSTSREPPPPLRPHIMQQTVMHHRLLPPWCGWWFGSPCHVASSLVTQLAQASFTCPPSYNSSSHRCTTAASVVEMLIRTLTLYVMTR